MTTQVHKKPVCHALLIGIDKYLKNKLPDGSYYRDLSGCVRDINHVEQFLLTTLRVPRENIIKLTASSNGSSKPAEPPKVWPTYENMVAGFVELTKRAKPGDQVYIHYSGHGGRALSLIRDYKPNGLDEAIVPTNIGNSEARYLRDIEMVKLLKTMTDQKLLVTAVFDSCHSEGMTRGPDTHIRGISSVDTTERETTSIVANVDELLAAWRDTKSETRSLNATPWVPAHEGMVVLSACGPSEYAYEYAFDGKESNGALTYWFLNSLGELGLGLTYKQLHDRVAAKVHSQFQNQMPHLEGDGDRLVLGVDQIPSTYAAVVMAVDEKAKRLLLNTGQAQGVRRGSQFSIHSLTASSTNSDESVGVATVKEVMATDSWARFTSTNGYSVKQGDQATLINPGFIDLVQKVRLLKDWDKSSDKEFRAASNLLAGAIRKNRWLKLISTEDSVHFQIGISQHAEFEILDSSGSKLTTNLDIHDKDVITKVVNRLVHLAKFRMVQEIDNHDTQSPLARKLRVSWAGKQKKFEPGEKPAPRAFARNVNVPTVKAGEWIFLKIENLSDSVLAVAVLDLQPDWGISQVHPFPPAWFVELDPGCEELVALKAALPAGYKRGEDTLKVFASSSGAHYRWLGLPALDGVLATKNERQVQSDLDLLLYTLSENEPQTRNLSPATYPSREWTTNQITVNITS